MINNAFYSLLYFLSVISLVNCINETHTIFSQHQYFNNRYLIKNGIIYICILNRKFFDINETNC